MNKISTFSKNIIQIYCILVDYTSSTESFSVKEDLAFTYLSGAFHDCTELWKSKVLCKCELLLANIDQKPSLVFFPAQI